jgi:glutamyl-tRNA synthetase
LRADEWIPSSPVQLWLYASFGWPEPVWAHLPLVLNPGGQGKLSKRRRAADPIGSGAGGSAGTDHAGSDAEPEPPLTQVREYRAAGYLPEAMVNFLALLGWAYSGEDEIFDLAAAADRFDLEAVRPAPSEWDVAKLRWMNGVYVRALGPDDLAERMLPYLTGAGLAATIDQVRRMAPLVRERLETLADCVHWLAFFWAEDVSPDLDDLVPKKLDAPGAISVLAAAEEALGSIPEWSVAAIEIALRDLANRMGLAPAQAFGPVRVAVSGQRVSPPLFDTLEIVGRQVTLRRLASARERLTARGR